ncbi:single-pass membrane and coiled-coil domain-containing protein 3 [Amia ocellicauda]|uniref:single-pass membrane and coiled-coil domain-containing protein 3 n=1 Tax=Amia ocellicauda TaxID=2972642 RepID=UPI0034644137
MELEQVKLKKQKNKQKMEPMSTADTAPLPDPTMDSGKPLSGGVEEEPPSPPKKSHLDATQPVEAHAPEQFLPRGRDLENSPPTRQSLPDQEEPVNDVSTEMVPLAVKEQENGCCSEVVPAGQQSSSGLMSTMSWVSSSISSRCSQVREFASSFGGGLDKPKEDLARACQTLYMLMETYATTTNKARDVVNQHFNTDIPPFPFHQDRSLREHVELVRGTVGHIYREPELTHKHVQSKLEPSMYAKIRYAGVSWKEKMEIIKELDEKYMGLLGSVSAPLIAVLLVKSGVGESALPPPADLQLPAVLPPLAVPRGPDVLDLRVDDLLKSSEWVCKTLTGGKSKSDYERAIQLVQETVDVFRPHCEGYADVISEVRAYVAMVAESLEK